MELKFRDSTGLRVCTGDIAIVGRGTEESMGEVVISNDFGPGVRVEFVRSRFTGGEWRDIRGAGVTIIKPLMTYAGRFGRLKGVTIQRGIMEPVCKKAATA